MENGGLDRGKLTKDSVISKIKDDGDFDRLRLKIVRKLKDDDELRSSIISTVRQSEAYNRPSAKKMKPWQLKDAISQEVGAKVMGEISDGLWKIIRSGDGMMIEINETIQSVCNKLLNPNVNEGGETSSGANLRSVQKGLESNGNATSSACEINGRLSDSAPNEPPSIVRSHLGQNTKNNHEEPGMPMLHDNKARDKHKLETRCSEHRADPNGKDTSSPPGFSKATEHDQPGDGNDEDPDVPPGFG